MTQPAVAEQVRKLEQALGADLFVRAGRGVALSEAGRAFSEHAIGSLRAVEAAADSIDEVTALRTGTIAIGVFGGPSAWNLDEVAAAFLRRHPDVSLRLVGRNSSAIADAVRRGELEAGLVALPIDDRGLVVGERVWTTEAVYATADRDRLRGTPRTIQQLAAAQLVVPEAQAGDEDPTRRRLRERAADAGVQLQPVVEVESSLAALDLVLRGVGDTIASAALIAELGLGDRVETVPLDPPLHERYAFITPRGAPRAPAMAALIAIIEAHLGLDLEPSP